MGVGNIQNTLINCKQFKSLQISKPVLVLNGIYALKTFSSVPFYPKYSQNENILCMLIVFHIKTHTKYGGDIMLVRVLHQSM
jgi:hypothetical protein